MRAGDDAPAAREHRRMHRRGVPSNIDRDPELRTWIEARIDTHTFQEVADMARADFGARRAPSRSSIYRWWRANRARLLSAPSQEKE